MFLRGLPTSLGLSLLARMVRLSRFGSNAKLLKSGIWTLENYATSKPKKAEQEANATLNF